MTTLRIATRRSPLALWQTEHVKHALLQAHPNLQVEIVEMVTQGDKILDTPLAKIGGKGLFVKELEQGMLDGQADIAVHSMKDVPVEFPDGLMLSTIMPRENPHDAFVSNRHTNFDALPNNAIVGTSSLRRQAQLLACRPDLQIRTLRGNVNTRLQKLDNGEYDAIILAVAGLKRLGMSERIRAELDSDILLPAIGQGAVGIECRTDDAATRELLTPLNDATTYQCVMAERAINRVLGGGCQVPIGGFAQIMEEEMWLRGLVADEKGQTVLRSEVRGNVAQAVALGEQVGNDLLAQGADALLQALHNAT